jgi:hypothetical protein
VRPYFEKTFTKIGLVEWLKLKALSSSPSIVKKINLEVSDKVKHFLVIWPSNLTVRLFFLKKNESIYLCKD